VVEIRKASEEDNQALIELLRRCPMGTSLVLGADCSPDFFARSKPFEDWSVFVAVDDNRIVGSAGYAVKDTYVDRRLVKAAYEYGFMVDPQQRRKGIAVKLQERIEHDAIKKNVDLLHLDVIQDNLPSMNFFSKMGFEKVRDSAIFSLMVYKRQKPVRESNIRRIEESDLESVVNMINGMYGDYNLFDPFQTGSLLDYVRRMPHFDLRNILVFRDAQGVRACVGYWDYNRVTRYVVQQLNRQLRTQSFLVRLAGLFTDMPHIPRPGEPLSSYNLVLLAFRDAECARDLIRHVINIAMENKINFLHVPMDPESPIATVLSQFRHINVILHVFAKSLRHNEFSCLGRSKLYIDVNE
jgi:ribosomal protein S18 acetylase RimI-like enzyme